MKQLLARLRAKWQEFVPTLLVEDKRKRFQLTLVYAIFAAVSVVMSVLNIITGESLVLISTLAFAAVSIGNLTYITRPGASLRLSAALFCLSVAVLFVFFIVSGKPDGFSILWICLLPSCGMLLLGRREGSAFFALMLMVVLLFFHTQIGRSLLLFDYGKTFRTRYPFLLVAIYLVSLLLETVRVVTSSALEKSRRDYEYLYQHDALTGALNRHGFNEFLASLDAQAPVVFMILDIDDFKHVNDRYGHPAGDAVLKNVAGVLSRELPETARLYRWGGEEFAVIQPGCGDAQAAQDLANKLRRAVDSSAAAAGGRRVTVTISAGVVTGQPGEDPGQTLLRAADDCLYEAKRTGKDRCICRVAS